MSFQILEAVEFVSSSLEKDDVDSVLGDAAFHARPTHRTKTLSMIHEEPLVNTS